MPTIHDILTPQGQPRVNVPFTRGGRTYRITGLSRTGKAWTYTLEWLECPVKENRFKEVSEAVLFGK